MLPAEPSALTAVITGNACLEGRDRGGWFMGHFISPDTDPRSTPNLEIKWGIHPAGESRTAWSINREATTLSILIQGRFRVQFRDRDCVLAQPGDYVLWLPGVPHGWVAESDSTILTVRFPSISGDSVAATQGI